MNAAMLMVCLAGSAAVGQNNDTIFKAPGIEIRSYPTVRGTQSTLIYNGINIGRQYHKSKDEPDLHLMPATYYHDKNPIGLVLNDKNWFPKKGAPPIAVLGMGIGTLAAYAQPGQMFHFIERVPTFVKLSLPDKEEKRYFTYVQDALDRGAKVKVFEGEPRALFEKHAGDKSYKMIVVETYKTPIHELHKGEQSFRGLYYSDPDIDKLGGVVYDIENFFINKVGVPYQYVSKAGRPIHGAIGAWSAASVEQLNRDSPASPKKKFGEKK